MATALQKKFWPRFSKRAQERRSPLRFKEKPKNHYWPINLSQRDFHLSIAVQQRPKERSYVECQLVIDGRVWDSNASFEQLEAQSDEIEVTLGDDLQWELLPDNQRSKISKRLSAPDLEDEDSWPSLIDWLLDTAEKFEATFDPRIQSLRLDS